MSINPAAIGKSFEDESFEITRARAMFYALSIGDFNDAYFDPRRPEGIVVHPLFASVYARGPVRAALLHPVLDMPYEQLFHFEQRFEWLYPVVPGDVISTRAVIKEVAFYENGGLVNIETVSTNQSGTPVLWGRWGYFDKSAGKPGLDKPKKDALSSSPVILENRVVIPSAQTFVYAEASGDKNPLHLDATHATGRGLRGIIVHGFNTMAYCAREIVGHLGNGDPTGLKAMSVRFARPVFPGETLTLKVTETASVEPGADHGFEFCALDAEDNAVIRNGVCLMNREGA